MDEDSAWGGNELQRAIQGPNSGGTIKDTIK